MPRFFRFALSTLLFTSLLFLVLAVPYFPYVFSMNPVQAYFPGNIVRIVQVIAHVALIVYFYKSGRFSLFSLPLSHVFFTIMAFASVVIMPFPPSRAMYGFYTLMAMVSVAIVYILPITVITLVISAIFKYKSIWR
ncbi:MAG: hypothetical protein FWG87_05480 [Defluviitaleaceae bacterium]|nr:hypothetical protein [Defluviitaleaceae bacterium]